MTKKKLKINWTDHLVNLFVVILGISIAFWLNEASEDDKNSQLKKVYLESMIRDLNQDVSDLNEIITEDSLSAIYFRGLFLEKIEDADSLQTGLSKLASLTTFSGHNVTYESLKSGGKIELFDVQTWLTITENYHVNYQSVKEIERYYQSSFDTKIIPFLMESVDSQIGISPDIIKKKSFKTPLALHITFLQQKIDAYQACRDSSTELLDLLNQQLTLI